MGVRIGIDTGGTFTDLIGFDESTGELVLAKTPSTPSEPVNGMVHALRASGVAPSATQFLILGTTVATNALLQRRGADVIFLTTEGFEDIPYIQRMNRRYHYSLEWTKPAPLVSLRVRMSARALVSTSMVARWLGRASPLRQIGSEGPATSGSAGRSTKRRP